jgi:hypothetical protein
MHLSILLTSNLQRRRVPTLIGTTLIPILLLLAAVGAQPTLCASSCKLSAAMVGARIQRSPNPSDCTIFQPAKPLRTGLPFPHFRSGPALTERTVLQFLVDIDQDGDSDLVALTNLPRVLVWINDGTGHFTTWYPSPSLHSSKIIEDADSNDEDSPLLFLWLDAKVLSLGLVPLASAQTDSKSPQVSFDYLSQSSPRAPPQYGT